MLNHPLKLYDAFWKHPVYIFTTILIYITIYRNYKIYIFRKNVLPKTIIFLRSTKNRRYLRLCIMATERFANKQQKFAE